MAMLIAADALSQRHRRADGSTDLPADIVFVSLAGESLGLTGSRRLLFDLQQDSNSTMGLNASRIDTVVEFGMLAAPYAGNTSRLFVHAAGGNSSAGAAFVRAGQSIENLEVRALLPVTVLQDKCGAPHI